MASWNLFQEHAQKILSRKTNQKKLAAYIGKSDAIVCHALAGHRRGAVFDVLLAIAEHGCFISTHELHELLYKDLPPGENPLSTEQIALIMEAIMKSREGYSDEEVNAGGVDYIISEEQLVWLSKCSASFLHLKAAHGTPSFYQALRDELAQYDTADLENIAQVIAQCDIENQIESEQDDEALYDFSPTLHPLVKRILPHVIKFGIGYRRTVLRFHKWASNGVGHFINKNLYAKPQIEN